MRIKEAGALTGALTGSRLRVRLIDPGQGSSGTYPPETIAEAAPLFTAGTHMYLNHATEYERYERPEGDLSKLVGVLESPAEVAPDGGLEATVKVFETWRGFIHEAAPYIGVSINGTGVVDENGVITQLTTIDSVDFVTKAGRGGKVTEILEAAREKISEGDDPSGEPTETEKVKEGDPVNVTITSEEHKRLTEAATKLPETEKNLTEATAREEELKAQIAELQAELEKEQAKTKAATEAAVKAEATSIVEEAFTGIEAPRGKARLVESAVAAEDFDAESFKKIVLEEAAEYAPKTGNVTGMGATSHITESDTQPATVADVLNAFGGK